MDLAKYRAIFVEDGTEHLAEMSRALLGLEKQPADGEAIDLIFRMAHSIKGMAASLGFDAITEVAHRLEDRMQVHRNAGRVEGPGELSLLLKGLAALESMVGAVRDGDDAPAADPALVAELEAPVPEAHSPAQATDEAPKKKARSR